MLMKRLACALGLALAVSCASTPSSAPHGEAQVERFSCPTSTGKTFGSTVRVGDAHLTAEHVVENCFQSGDIYKFADIDLAIIKPAKMTSCRAPVVGEKVVFQGYPATRKSGKPWTSIGARRFETSIGTVIETDRTMTFFDTSEMKVKSLQGHGYVGGISHIRQGYSGGAVTSLETGEFLGIISTGSFQLGLGSFVPADVICARMEEVL